MMDVKHENEEACMGYRNWSAICNVQNDLFRLTLATIDDPEILKGLERGFPDLFTNDPTDEPFIPIKALYRKAAEFWQGKFNFNDEDEIRKFIYKCEGSWSPACKVLNIPLIRFEDPIPEEIFLQLVGQQARAGITVTYYGIKHVVVDIPWALHNNLALSATITQVPSNMAFLSIVPARFIDLDK